MERTDETTGFGFFINDDLTPNVQLGLRIQVLHEQHADVFDAIEASIETDTDVTLPADKIDAVLVSIDETRNDVNTIYASALTGDIEEVDPDDFIEALMSLDGVRLNLMHLKAKQAGSLTT